MPDYGSMSDESTPPRELGENAPLLPRPNGMQDKATEWIRHELHVESMVASNLVLTLATS